MPPVIRPATSNLCNERDAIADRGKNKDRLPINIAAPIIVALSLSLWGGIGLVVSALL